MKRFLSCVLSLAALVVHAFRWLASLVIAPVAMALPKAGVVVERPRILLIAARAFVARWLMRRERARIETQWRMCPSA